MNSTLAYGNETFKEKERAYLGSAKLALHKIEFVDNPANSARPLDPKNVNRLMSIFELEGCFRLEKRNRVPVLLSEENFARAKTSGKTFAKPGDPDWLLLDTSVKCLHGRHRIAAANQVLGPGEKWWVVDIYREGSYKTPQA